jgi:hypothetical protein
MRKFVYSAAASGAFIALIAFTAQAADALGAGGGARAGGATSMSRGGGGGASAMNRGGGGFSGGSMSRSGNYSRPSGGASASQRPAGGNRANTGNVNTGNVNRGNVNTGNVNRGNINTGNINTGDVNINRDVHVDVDNDWNGWGGYYDHPRGAYAAGVVVGAATTAAVMGARYYALPTGCAPYPYSGFTYYSCSNVWYKPTYQGSTVVYVVVAKPN